MIRPARPLNDVHVDAVTLAGLACALDLLDSPTSRDQREAVAGIIAAIKPLARTIADDIEAMLRKPTADR